MIQKRLVTLLAALLVSVGLLYSPYVFASGDSLYLYPSSRTAYDGYTVSLTLYANAGDTTNAVQANLTYPASQLEYLSTSYSSSAFEIQAQSSGGGGNIQIARGTLSPFSGTRVVAVVSFRVLVSSGSGTVNFSGGSVLVNNGQSLTTGASGATLYFANAPPPAPTPPAPVVNKTPPTISKVTTTVSQNSALISWQTNEPSDSAINYGLNGNYGLYVSSTNQVTNHSLLLSSAFLEPDTTYHYQITSVDGNGNKQVDIDRTFTTASIVVQVSVKNTAGKAESGVQVMLDNQVATTNANGIATFNAGIGEYNVKVAGKQATESQSVAITSSNVGSKPVTVSFNLAGKTGLNIPTYVTLIFVLVVGIVIGDLFSHRRRIPALLFRLTGKQSLGGNMSASLHAAATRSTKNPYAQSASRIFSKFRVKR